MTLSSLTPAFVQIIRSQEILAESRSRPAEAQVEVKNLQAELLSTLRTLQEEQQQQQDSEKALDDDKVPKATCQCTSFVEFFFECEGNINKAHKMYWLTATQVTLKRGPVPPQSFAVECFQCSSADTNPIWLCLCKHGFHLGKIWCF